jgi:hypothetical protein
MSEDFFSNEDLSRRLIGLGATELLTANRSIRNAHQPCTRKFEQWRISGCKAIDDEDRRCLQAIGGLDSTLCQGEYDLTEMVDGWPMLSNHVSASAMVERVKAVLKEPSRPHITTMVAVSWTTGSVSLQSGVNKLLTVRKGNNHGKVRCHLTDAQLDEAVHKVFTRVGRIRLKCPANELRVPRSFTVRATRYHDLLLNDWILFTAERS